MSTLEIHHQHHHSPWYRFPSIEYQVIQSSKNPTIVYYASVTFFPETTSHFYEFKQHTFTTASPLVNLFNFSHLAVTRCETLVKYSPGSSTMSVSKEKYHTYTRSGATYRTKKVQFDQVHIQLIKITCKQINRKHHSQRLI